MFLRVFEPYPENNSIGNGLAVLFDAVNIHISSEINGMYSLEFDMPINSKNIKYLSNTNNWIDAGGNWYFIISMSQDKSSHLAHVICRHIMALLTINNTIEIFPVMIATDAKNILSEALRLSGVSSFGLLEQEELPDGMEWVDDLTDVVNGWDLVTVYDIIGNVLELLGYGELYFKNNKFAIVKKIGKDTAELLTPSKNIENIKINIDSAGIINELLVLGLNDMPLDIEKYPGSIITSEESIAKYGKRKGSIRIDTEDKEELEKKALWEFSPMNTERLDTPKVSLEVSAVFMNNALNLGDSVRVKDRELNIDEIKRIVAIDYWPNSPQDTKYTIGDRALTLEELLAKLEVSRDNIEKNTNTAGEITPEGLEQLSPFLQNSKNFVFNSSFEVYDENEIPKYWECYNGSKISKSSQNYGSVSLMIPPGGYAIQSIEAAIPISYYSTESNSTMVFMSHKWGACRVSIIDEEGQTVPHVSKYNPEKVEATTYPYEVYYRNFLYLTFLHEDIKSAEKKYRIKIENVDESQECYIDGVMATPNINGIIPLYRDGAHSQALYNGKDSQDEGSYGGSQSYTDNTYYYNSESNVNASNSEIIPLSLRIYKKDLKNDFYNINVCFSLILENIQSDIDIIATLNGLEIFRILRYNNGLNRDILTYQKTLTLPISSIGEDSGAFLEIKMSGTFKIKQDSTLTCTVSKNTFKRETLLKIDKMAEVGGELTGDIFGEIWRNERGEIVLDVQCIKSAGLASSNEFLTTPEAENIYNSVQVLNFYRSPESYITDIPAGMFEGHPELKTVNGLDCYLTNYTTLQSAFENCQKLQKVTTLPKDCTSYYNTFKGCTALNSVGVINLNYKGSKSCRLRGAFYGCSSLESVRIKSTDAATGAIGKISTLEDTFNGCTNLSEITGTLYGSTSDGALSSQAQRAFKDCVNLSGSLTMSRYWGANDDGTPYPSRITECFSGCSTAEGAALILDAPESFAALITTKSEDSNITSKA